MCSPRRSSGPFRGGGGGPGLPQAFDHHRGHHAGGSLGGDGGQSSVSQPPPRFSRRVESTVIEAQRVTVAAAMPNLAPTQPVAVVPAAVMPPPAPPPTQLTLADQTTAPPTRYTQSVRIMSELFRVTTKDVKTVVYQNR